MVRALAALMIKLDHRATMQYANTFRTFPICFLAFAGLFGTPLEEACSIVSTLDAIHSLESNQDPKCHATATRLEYSIYGTPLTQQARILKNERQKEFIDIFWSHASALAESSGAELISEAQVEAALSDNFNYELREENGAQVTLTSGQRLTIEADDLRHYGSVAYSLRAMLSLKQDLLLQMNGLRLPFSEDAEAVLIKATDVATLAMLQHADRSSREDNVYEIRSSSLNSAWKVIFSAPISNASVNNVTAGEPVEILSQLIERKLLAYEEYNEIRSQVFLRNLQVYFARFKWPKDSEGGLEFKKNFTEANALFLVDLMQRASRVAAEANSPFVREEHVIPALQILTPHTINEFEDVIYFPKFPNSNQILIEAYDVDSFRDSGLHWRYLEYALEKMGDNDLPEVDPFAAELLVEGAAQFAVLLLRLSGDSAAGSDAETLQPEHLFLAFQKYNELLRAHIREPNRSDPVLSIPSKSLVQTCENSALFSDVTDKVKINFIHQSADWLHRLLRSYIKTGKDSATLAIPPAFGGGGIAAEDINGDHLPDLLILGGRGNSLYLNQADQGFKEITESAGLDWQREDGTFGEARQPIIADFDNDGIQDILIIFANDAHRLYRGIGLAKFEDVTASTHLGGKGLIAGPAITFDYDRDGLLDLYIGYFGNYLEGNLPNLERRNENGTPNKLFRNKGNFCFEEVTLNSGTNNSGWTQALGHTDLDGDGWQDIIVGNDFGINAYLRNDGNGQFVDKSSEWGTDKPSFTMNVGIGDLNRDLMPDIYISNIVTLVKDDKYVLPEAETAAHFYLEGLTSMHIIDANDIFLSEVIDGKLNAYRQGRQLMGRGNSATGWSWDADFFDADNDGDDDLYCVNGMNDYAVYSETPYYTAVNDSEAEIQLVASSQATNVFFSNDGGFLKNKSAESGLDILSNSRSAVYFDYDNDGDLDIALNDYHASANVFENHAERNQNNWLKIKLVGSPEKNNNRDAIGARLLLETEGGDVLWREVHGGVGYLSLHPKEQHFGLGKDLPKRLTIRWPNGEAQVIENLKPNRRHLIHDSNNSTTLARD